MLRAVTEYFHTRCPPPVSVMLLSVMARRLSVMAGRVSVMAWLLSGP